MTKAKAPETEAGYQGAPVTEAITRFAIRTPGDAIPDSARQVARLSLFDWVAVAVAGRDEPVSRILRQLVAAEGGAAEATVIGLDAKLPARAAALPKGTAAHALDFDDTHFGYIGHPSAVVMSASLAMAEKTGLRGPEVLDAMLIGVETACRIGAWLGRRHYQHGFHQTATAGCFGAAMAAARLLRLDEAQAAYALGLAASRASGLKAQFGTMGKPYHAGMAAANGVEAALLAAAGFVSRPDSLECAQGFAATHAGEAGDPAAVLDGLGRSFIFEGVQHKFHACCHGTHAALEALIEAREAHHLKVGDIQSVTLVVHPRYLTVCNIAEPATGLEAKFSFRLTAAMVLAGRDTAVLSTFSDGICAEAELVALRDLVTVETDASMAETAATVLIKQATGPVIEVHHDLDRPLPIALREAKIRAKAASLLGAAAADRLWQELGTLNGTLDDWVKVISE